MPRIIYEDTTRDVLAVFTNGSSGLNKDGIKFRVIAPDKPGALILESTSKSDGMDSPIWEKIIDANTLTKIYTYIAVKHLANLAKDSEVQ